MMFTTNPLKCYPVAAAPVNVSSPAAAWNWGALTQIVPASTISNDFIICGVFVRAPDPATLQWQVQLTYGGGDTVFASFSGAAEGDYSAVKGHAIKKRLIKIPADSVIKAKMTDSSGGAQIYKVRIYYIEV